MPDPYDIKSYSDFLRIYPYLAELEKQYPPSFYPQESQLGVEGMVSGSRYGPKTAPLGVHIALGLSPQEEADVKRHEYSHLATELSPNWRDIMATEKSSQNLNHLLGLTYEKPIRLEEAMIRLLNPSSSGYREITREPRLLPLLTPEQEKLSSYFRSRLQYGPQWGSFIGPEYDERELREGKGQDILPIPRQEGGPVSLGRSYLVGEKGPEVIMPNEQGNVVPLQKIIMLWTKMILPLLMSKDQKFGSDTELMRGKGDLQRNEPEMTPPKKYSATSPETKLMWGRGEMSGKNEPETVPTTWQQMVVYP